MILKIALWDIITDTTNKNFGLWFFIVTLHTVAQGMIIIMAGSFLRGGEIMPRGLAFTYRPTLTVGITFLPDGTKQIQTKDLTNALCKPAWTEKDFMLAKELPFWKNPPKNFRDLFNFPNAIDQSDAKIKAAMLSMEIIGFLAIDYFLLFPWMYIYIVFSSLSRFLFASRFNLESWITLLVIRELVQFRTYLVPSPPKRFAQLISFVFSLAYVILRIGFNLTLIANWLAAIHLCFCLLEACFSVCAACAVFQLGMIVGLVPNEICKECQIMFAVNPNKTNDPVSSVTENTLNDDTLKDNTL